MQVCRAVYSYWDIIQPQNYFIPLFFCKYFNFITLFKFLIFNLRLKLFLINIYTKSNKGVQAEKKREKELRSFLIYSLFNPIIVTVNIDI